ncbi:beta-ketoacyl synthase N-terminal-like domain-containing protein [Amycolatopsis ultiminotia]|uniref:Beta-ketoacyl synthase N-terminal-like domain-containing protein n=1 Tax=Amycolatopsis ultiminotia TaxID=543629 RepID=A0ABP6XHF8_9PSEU
MGHDVVITGYGVFTAFGFGEQALRDGVFAGRPGFAPVTRFDATPFRAGHAAAFGGDGPAVPGVPVGPGSTPTQAEILEACGRAALAQAGLTARERASAAVLLGTNGDHNRNRAFWEAVDGAGQSGAPDVTDSLPAQLPHVLAESLGLGRPRIAYVNACVASTNAVVHGAQLIRSGRVDRVLAGGAYVVGEDVFSRFDSGRALTRADRVRPFTKGRSGLLLGDGVATLVLESAESARARGAEPLVRIAGWGMAADAFHVIQPHPEGKGLAKAATAALAVAGVAPAQVGYVNAHGTGTPLNDVAETAALHRLFGADPPPVSSTKSTTGHMLEATGAVEAVITAVALRAGVLPPTAGYDVADPECDLDCVPNEPRRADPRYALSLNAAFGGVNAALLLEKL